jgi:hypothetical protein
VFTAIALDSGANCLFADFNTQTMSDQSKKERYLVRDAEHLNAK